MDCRASKRINEIKGTMKKLILLILLMLLIAGVSSAEWVALLCPTGLTNETAIVFGGSHVKGVSGMVYKASWAPDYVIAMADSATHTNVSVEALGAFLPTLPTLGKSVSIHGLTDPTAFLLSIGAVRCDSDGNEFEDTVE